MKTVNYLRTLDYCDGPLLFEARDDIGGHYLGMAVEAAEGADAFVVVGVAPERLRRFRAGLIDLRDLVLEAGKQEWFFTDSSDFSQPLRLSARQSPLAASEYLSEAGYFMDNAPTDGNLLSSTDDSGAESVSDETLFNALIARIEAGVLPWRKPWADTSKRVIVGSMPIPFNSWPSNLRAPKTSFGVFHGTLLMTRALERGYRSNLWVEKKVLDDIEAEVDRNDPLAVKLKSYWSYLNHEPLRPPRERLVYNIDQVLNCEESLGLTFREDSEHPPQQMCFKDSMRLREKLIKTHCLEIVPGSDRAAYSPSWDTVMMPNLGQFCSKSGNKKDGEANYWATLWHEVIHWTGHYKRLNRERHVSWGDKIYAFEELVAELGAAFLCAHLGIEGELQHESYLASWSQAFKGGEIQKLAEAGKLASEAKTFVLGKKAQPGNNDVGQTRPDHDMT